MAAEAEPVEAATSASATASPTSAPEAPTESENKEAVQYWGYLLKPDNCGTDLLNRLLAGLAHYIVCWRGFSRHLEAAWDKV
jgi:hypothetical protein